MIKYSIGASRLTGSVSLDQIFGKEMFLKGIQIRKQILSHNWMLDLVLYRKWGHSLVLPHKGLQVGQLSATCISFLRKPFSCRRVLLKHKVCNRLAHLGVSSLMKCLYFINIVLIWTYTISLFLQSRLRSFGVLFFDFFHLVALLLFGVEGFQHLIQGLTCVRLVGCINTILILGLPLPQ